MGESEVKIYAVTTVFCKPDILEQSLARFKETTSGVISGHIILEDHYPLNQPADIEKIQALAKEYNAQYVRSEKNLGLHKALNLACSYIPLERDDLVIVYDHDSYPVEKGWDMAMTLAMSGGRRDIGCVSLWNWKAAETPDCKWEHQEQMDGLKLRINKNRPAMISIPCWRWSLIQDAGGFQEPTQFYGGLEAEMWSHLQAYGLKNAYLEDYTESFQLYNQHDPEYKSWKDSHGKPGGFKGNFAEWLTKTS